MHYLILTCAGLLCLAVCVAFFKSFLSQWSLIRGVRQIELTDEERERIARRVQLAGLTGGKVGLVLGGGGGKGAYQIGCWRALEEFGVKHFRVIAGTSVGALNAALVAQGSYEKAYSVWSKIGPQRVLKVTPLLTSLALLPRLLLLPYFAYKYVKCLRGSLKPSLWEAYYFYRREEEKNGIGWLALYFSVLKKLIANHRWWLESLSWLLLLGVTSFIVGLFLPQTEPNEAVRQVFPQASTQAFPDALWHVIRFLFALPSLLCLLVLLWGVLLWMDQRLATRHPLFSNQPLANLLGQNFTPGALGGNAPPVYVTLATLRRVKVVEAELDAEVKEKATADVGSAAVRKTVPATVASKEAADTAAPPKGFRGKLTEFWKRHINSGSQDFGRAEIDPDYGWVKIDPDSGVDAPPGATTTVSSDGEESARVKYVPYYFKLQDFGYEQMKELVLQSAALPEIFPSKVFSGDSYVDGGIADNLPLLPALCAANTELVIVISLNDRRSVAELPAALKELRGRSLGAERLDREQETPPALNIFKNVWPPTSWSLEGLSHLRLPALSLKAPKPLDLSACPRGATTRVLPIVPSRSLGGFLSGTLNFLPSKAQALMRLGYNDTINVLLRDDPYEIRF